MKGVFKRVFNKTTNRQKPLGEIVIGLKVSTSRK